MDSQSSTDSGAVETRVSEPDRPVLVDAMLGTLVTYLRMCGYDAAFTLERGLGEDAAIRATARAERRTVLTRDRELAARADDAVLLETRETDEQLAELAAAGFELELPAEPRRCGNCNGRLAPVAATETTAAYAPEPGETDVWRCRDCAQLFWRGSHWADVAERLAGH